MAFKPSLQFSGANGFLSTTLLRNVLIPISRLSEHLFNSLGFSKEQTLVISSKVSCLKSPENPIHVIDFFKSNGFEQTHFTKVVSSRPKILSCSVDKTIKPKINALVDIGLCGSDLAHVVSASPEFCSRSLDNHIIPVIGYLKSVFGNYGAVVCVVKKSSWLLGCGASKNLPVVVSLLQSYGLSNDQIKSFALKRARCLALDAKLLQPVLIWVDKRLGIPRGTPMFVHGICALSSISEDSLESRIRVYKGCGLTDLDALMLGRKNPYALVVSESQLKSCLDFFLKVAEFQPAVIVSMPKLMTFSLEKRVIPRYRIWKVLNEKRLKKHQPSLIHSLNIEERLFLKRFVLPFKDELSVLYDDYVKKSTMLEAVKD